MTLIMEATKNIVSQAPLEGAREHDEFNRQPFENESLLSVDNLNVVGPQEIASRESLQALADSVGLMDVMRWKPRMVCITFNFSLVSQTNNRSRKT